MAARGAESKEIIIQKILETFDNSFKFDKEIRIPMEENGEIVEIKVTLTCAKTNVRNDVSTLEDNQSTEVTKQTAEKNLVEPTEEEKQRVADLISKLGL